MHTGDEAARDASDPDPEVHRQALPGEGGVPAWGGGEPGDERRPAWPCRAGGLDGERGERVPGVADERQEPEAQSLDDEAAHVAEVDDEEGQDDAVAEAADDAPACRSQTARGKRGSGRRSPFSPTSGRYAKALRSPSGRPQALPCLPVAAPETIEFLYFADCPSHEEALALLRNVLEERGIERPIAVREVSSDEDALRLGFPGSPTIRIDGRDVDPAGGSARPSLSCRVYRLPDGRVSPLPAREQIEEALP